MSLFIYPNISFIDPIVDFLIDFFLMVEDFLIVKFVDFLIDYPETLFY